MFLKNYTEIHNSKMSPPYLCLFCTQISQLHLYDCLRANKAMMAWGVEVGSPITQWKVMRPFWGT